MAIPLLVLHIWSLQDWVCVKLSAAPLWNRDYNGQGITQKTRGRSLILLFLPRPSIPSFIKYWAKVGPLLLAISTSSAPSASGVRAPRTQAREDSEEGLQEFIYPWALNRRSCRTSDSTTSLVRESVFYVNACLKTNYLAKPPITLPVWTN